MRQNGPQYALVVLVLNKITFKLLGMNVIMPTAMVTMHEDESLSAQSATTAARGIKVLAALKGISEVEQNCQAIQAVATGKDIADQEKMKVRSIKVPKLATPIQS